MITDFLIPFTIVVLGGSAIYIYVNVKAELKKRKNQKKLDGTK